MSGKVRRFDAVWASTLPWDCLIRETNCVSPTHDHSPMVGDKCAACPQLLVDGEECYAVTDLPRRKGREQWVCWRHVRDEPVTVPAAAAIPESPAKCDVMSFGRECSFVLDHDLPHSWAAISESST